MFRQKRSQIYCFSTQRKDHPMLKMAVRNTNKLVREKVKTDNIRLGRLFTKADTARLMANFCSLTEKHTVRVLDPGAGTGILTAALLERICQSPNLREVDLVCYENDVTYLPMLKYNLDKIRRRVRKLYGVKLVVNILEENYILSGRESYTINLFRENADYFDYVIMNPPSALMPSDSPEALAIKDLFGGSVDLCYLFLAMAASALAKDGELVTLIPTVFSTSPQMAKLRHFLFSENTLVHMHLFCQPKAGKPLKKEMVLHLSHRAPTPQDNVTITVSSDSGTPAKTELLPPQPLSTVLRGQDKTMLLLKDPGEIQVMRYMQSLSCSFATYGLRMKTGLTLPSRYKDHLYDTHVPGTIPLIYPAAVREGRVQFPQKIKGQFLMPVIPSLAHKNHNMLLIHRIPAKSEKRRLVCGVYLSSQMPGQKFISTHNKLNYIDRTKGEIDPPFLFGLYAFLSSAICDTYIRLISKSSQVNAKELSDLPLPKPDVLRRIGSQLISVRVYTPQYCDKVIFDVLHVAMKSN